MEVKLNGTCRVEFGNPVASVNFLVEQENNVIKYIELLEGCGIPLLHRHTLHNLSKA